MVVDFENKYVLFFGAYDGFFRGSNLEVELFFDLSLEIGYLVLFSRVGRRVSGVIFVLV